MWKDDRYSSTVAFICWLTSYFIFLSLVQFACQIDQWGDRWPDWSDLCVSHWLGQDSLAKPAEWISPLHQHVRHFSVWLLHKLARPTVMECNIHSSTLYKHFEHTVLDYFHFLQLYTSTASTYLRGKYCNFNSLHLFETYSYFLHVKTWNAYMMWCSTALLI